MYINIELTDRYYTDLVLFLERNIDDGYSKQWANFSDSEKRITIDEFGADAIERIKSDIDFQNINSKHYRVDGESNIFKLKKVYFKFDIISVFED